MGADIHWSTGLSALPQASLVNAPASNRDAILPSGIFSFFCRDFSPSKIGFSKSKIVPMHQMLSASPSDVNAAKRGAHFNLSAVPMRCPQHPSPTVASIGKATAAIGRKVASRFVPA
ncbi:MAG: hypothetical protein WCP35_20160 [Verrucomicrobiota bacterium]